MDFSQPGFTTVHHQNVWGDWTFVFEGNVLCALTFENSVNAEVRHGQILECSQGRSIQQIPLEKRALVIYRKVVLQMNEYLSGRRKTFDIPIKIYGTEFQVKVWEALQKIPYGKTWSYQQLAEFIGEPSATRAVGGALHKNPLQIILPCHRVIGKQGELTGYALGLGLKRKLLEIEGAVPPDLLTDLE